MGGLPASGPTPQTYALSRPSVDNAADTRGDDHHTDSCGRQRPPRA
jgi:hypothetical protein